MSISEDVLHFMETSVKKSQCEYLEVIEGESITMRQAAPEVMDVLRSKLALELFASSIGTIASPAFP